MSDPYPLEKPRRRGCLPAALALLAGLALVAFALWRVGDKVDALRLRGEQLASSFQQAFHFTPQITSRSTTIIAATTPALELVSVKKDALVRNEWSQTWLGSTKLLEIEATFTARAGFDLTRPFQIEIQPDGSLVISLPPAQILDIAMANVHTLRDEDGLWNLLTSEDRDNAIHALESKARQQFESTPLLSEAQAEVERRIRELLPKDAKAVFRLSTAATPGPTPRL